MAKRKNGPGAREGVVNFMEVLNRRRLQELDTLLRPVVVQLTGYAHGVRMIHAYRTALGNELAIVMSALEKRGFAARRIAAIRREIAAADKLFEDAAKLTGTYEHALDAYGKAVQHIAALLKTKVR